MRRLQRRIDRTNVLLAANVMLVGALVWTNIAGNPLVAANAVAAPQGAAQTTNPDSGGIPNAGLQRLTIIQELRALRGDLQRLETMLESGKTKVNVGNLAEIKLEIDYNRLKAAIKD